MCHWPFCHQKLIHILLICGSLSWGELSWSTFISHRPFRFDQMGQWEPLIWINGPMGAYHLVKTKRTMTDERATCVCSYLSVLPLKRSHLIMENLHLWGGSVAAAASAGIELASTDYSGNMILQNWKQWVNVIFRPCLISNCAITRLGNIQCGFHTVFSNYHFHPFIMKQGMNVVRISALSGLNEILVHIWRYDRT